MTGSKAVRDAGAVFYNDLSFHQMFFYNLFCISKMYFKESYKTFLYTCVGTSLGQAPTLKVLDIHYTVGSLKDWTNRSACSKTTLITDDVGGTDVNSPSWKTGILFS